MSLEKCLADAVRGTANEQLVSSTVKQVLTGYVVGDTSKSAQCTVCGDDLQAGAIVFAIATRCVEQQSWDMPRVYCVGCAPATIDSPTLGVTEALVGGRLGTLSLPTTRTHHHCLTELAVRAYSPPTEA